MVEVTDHWTNAIRASDYMGWVAYVEGCPIFEAEPPYIGPLNTRGGLIVQPRPYDRTTMDWDRLPHEKVTRVELWYGREFEWISQPLVHLICNPGDDVRFICYKQRALVQHTAATMKRDPDDPDRLVMHTSSVERTGVTAYRIGFWDRPKSVCRMFEACANREEILTCLLCGEAVRHCNCLPVSHPCWPRPWGFGIAPGVVGLRLDQVPSPPDDMSSILTAGVH